MSAALFVENFANSASPLRPSHIRLRLVLTDPNLRQRDATGTPPEAGTDLRTGGTPAPPGHRMPPSWLTATHSTLDTLAEWVPPLPSTPDPEQLARHTRPTRGPPCTSMPPRPEHPTSSTWVENRARCAFSAPDAPTSARWRETPVAHAASGMP